jgi:predicted transcriptional regulator
VGKLVNNAQAILMSIRPRFAKAIFSGEKEYEYRRVKVRVTTGQKVLVYESAPTSGVVGEFIAGEVLVGRPSQLARLESTPTMRAAVRAYLEGANQATAIEVTSPRRWRTTRPLDDYLGGDRPPQSYVFVEV